MKEGVKSLLDKHYRKKLGAVILSPADDSPDIKLGSADYFKKMFCRNEIRKLFE